MRRLLLVLGLCACASADKGEPPVTKPATRPAREIVSGGGDLRGGSIRMAVTVGGPLGPRAAKPPVHPAGVVTP